MGGLVPSCRLRERLLAPDILSGRQHRRRRARRPRRPGLAAAADDTVGLLEILYSYMGRTGAWRGDAKPAGYQAALLRSINMVHGYSSLVDFE